MRSLHDTMFMEQKNVGGLLRPGERVPPLLVLDQDAGSGCGSPAGPSCSTHIPTARGCRKGEKEGDEGPGRRSGPSWLELESLGSDSRSVVGNVGEEGGVIVFVCT